jgi:hypothetical protein
MDRDWLRCFIDSLTVQQELAIHHILGGNSQRALFFKLRHGEWQMSKQHTHPSR